MANPIVPESTCNVLLKISSRVPKRAEIISIRTDGARARSLSRERGRTLKFEVLKSVHKSYYRLSHVLTVDLIQPRWLLDMKNLRFWR